MDCKLRYSNTSAEFHRHHLPAILMSRQPKFEILFSKLQVDVPDSNWHKTERIRKAEVVFYCGIKLSRWRKKGSRQPTQHTHLRSFSIQVLLVVTTCVYIFGLEESDLPCLYTHTTSTGTLLACSS